MSIIVVTSPPVPLAIPAAVVATVFATVEDVPSISAVSVSIIVVTSPPVPLALPAAVVATVFATVEDVPSTSTVSMSTVVATPIVVPTVPDVAVTISDALPATLSVPADPVTLLAISTLFVPLVVSFVGGGFAMLLPVAVRLSIVMVGDVTTAPTYL